MIATHYNEGINWGWITLRLNKYYLVIGIGSLLIGVACLFFGAPASQGEITPAEPSAILGAVDPTRGSTVTATQPGSTQPPTASLPAVQTAPPTREAHDLGSVGSFSQSEKVEIVLAGPQSLGMSEETNPFDLMVDVRFTGPGGQTYLVPAFYDGDGAGGLDGDVWKVRFTPDEAGLWTFLSTSAAPVLDGYRGSFEVNLPDDCLTAEGEGLLNLRCMGSLEYAGGHYFKFRNGNHWLKGGIDDPEVFLGKAFGDWNGKKRAIDYLTSQGVNSIYFVTNNIDGDGQDTWPWVGDTQQEAKQNSNRFDVAKLQKWEDFFDYAQARGIVLHFVLMDDDSWRDFDHERYYREMVARFGHHPGLIWNIGEEANEIYTNQEQIALAGQLQQLDPFNHPVTVHRLPTWPFLGNPNFDAASMQVGNGAGNIEGADLDGLNSVVSDHREMSVEEGRPIAIMIDEMPRVQRVNDAVQDKVRQEVIYPIYLGGGNYEMHFADEYTQDGRLDISDLEPLLGDMRRARRLIESLPFDQMQPCNDLLSGSNDNLCFGKSGEVYIVYLPHGGSLSIDLTALSGGLSAGWFDPRTGSLQSFGLVDGGGSRSFTAPDDQDWLLRLGEPVNNPCFLANLASKQWNTAEESAEVSAEFDFLAAFNVFVPLSMSCN
jgi:hypothetical protein